MKKQRRFLPILLTLLAHIVLLNYALSPRRPVLAPTIVAEVTLTEIPVITKFKPTPKVKAVVAPKVQAAQAAPELAHIALAAPVETAAAVTETTAIVTTAVAAIAPAPAPEPVVVATAPVDAVPSLKTLAPPSASYKLDVVRTEVNVANPYYGAGEIRWELTDSGYQMHVEVGVDLLFTTLRLYSIDSQGSIVDTGVKPNVVTEARRTRSATATHFNYDTNTISFSASTAKLAMQPGAQDKATVLMQLASIGNADATQFSQGKQITIQVAEEKEANPYQFVVVGQETIDTKLGHLETWHVVRPPLAGAYTSRLDIWLAPQYHWIPVQIRNSEANGAITTQTIRKITAGLNS